MEEKKLSDLISLFDFVKLGMIKSEKTWENLINLFDWYFKNKNLKIQHSSRKIKIDKFEFMVDFDNTLTTSIIKQSILNYYFENKTKNILTTKIK